MGVFTRDNGPSPRRRRRNPRTLAASSPASARLPSAFSAAPVTPAADTIPGPTTRPRPYNAPRGMTAAARTINLDSAEEVERLAKRRVGDDWQAEAWDYYDAIGEIKYALNLVANVCSRVRLHPAKVEDPSTSPRPVTTDDGAAAGAAITAMGRLDSAFGGQPGLIRDAALNIAVTGECFLTQLPGNPILKVPESWDVRSVDELEVKKDGTAVIKLRRDASGTSMSSNTNVIRLPKKAFVARIWRPHPRFSDEADSSMRGILDLCAELLLLNRTFRATARSRLNAGALYLPDGLSVAANPDPDMEMIDPDDPDAAEMIDPALVAPIDEAAEDDFEEALMDAMTTPISDEESAAAVVPLIIRGPAELGDKIKQFKFERSFDPALAQRSDRVLERIMQGIDVPKDVVTGLANVKYSNAIQIDESLYKAHIEPLILLLCDALTVIYLRPSLAAAGIDPTEASQYVVWYDPAEVTTRPDRAEDADAGFDRHAVSYAAWRRSHGFNEGDAPSPEEIAMRMLIEKGGITPELVEMMLGAIAPEFMERVRGVTQQANGATAIPGDVQDILNGGVPPAPTEPPAPAAPEPTGPPLPNVAPGVPPSSVGPGGVVNPEEIL